LAGAHRFTGLRAYAFGKVLEMQWPEHPNFPSYGYTITRHDLDGLVADERAVKAGATLLQGTEVVAADLIDEAVHPPRHGSSRSTGPPLTA
jgi:flavin-dependent dehydrogenase